MTSAINSNELDKVKVRAYWLLCRNMLHAMDTMTTVAQQVELTAPSAGL